MTPRVPGPTTRVAIFLTGLVLLACVLSVGWRAKRLQQRRVSAATLKRQSPSRQQTDGYVSSDACKACHPAEHASWHRTYHRTMTQVASPTAVVGDFDDVSLAYFGKSFHLQTRGDEFWISQEGGHRARVVQTTGSHHYQVYWVNGGEGNMLHNFPFVYLIEDQRWARRNDVFMVPPSIGSQPEGVRPWNDACIACHATHGQPRVTTSQPGHAKTAVAELGISCEACHGPADEHVRHYSQPATRYRKHFHGDDVAAKIVNPATCAPKQSVQICGQCHAVSREEDRQRWNKRGFSYRPGDELEDTRVVLRHPSNATANARVPADLFPKYFWNDGMIRVSGREYNGLIESPCYQQGELSCLSCHSMHDSDPNDQIKPGMHGDNACTQCHNEIASDIAAHTHHSPTSSGSTCYNCHMPHTTYGLLKAIRSHEIESPDLHTTISSGRPHACNLCHLDKTLEWTADYMDRWYGHAPPQLTDEQREVSAAVLDLLRGDAGQRAIVAWHMGWKPAWEASGGEWMAPLLAELLSDPYSVVRYISVRSLRRLPGFANFAFNYTDSPTALLEAVDRAQQQWKSTTRWSQASPTTLIEAEGGLMDTRIREIKSRRDDSPVDLLE